jgi:hypothetical protein
MRMHGAAGDGGKSGGIKTRGRRLDNEPILRRGQWRLWDYEMSSIQTE